MRAFAAALLLLCSASAHADRLWLHGLSHHTSSGDYNEVNEGFGVELSIIDRTFFEFGRYRNSFKRPTRYAWIHHEFADYKGWRFGAALGVADNYDCKRDDDSSDKRDDDSSEKNARCKKFKEGEGVPLGGFTVTYWRIRGLLIPNKDLSGVEVVALSARVFEW